MSVKQPQRNDPVGATTRLRVSRSATQPQRNDFVGAHPEARALLDWWTKRCRGVLWSIEWRADPDPRIATPLVIPLTRNGLTAAFIVCHHPITVEPAADTVRHHCHRDRHVVGQRPGTVDPTHTDAYD